MTVTKGNHCTAFTLDELIFFFFLTGRQKNVSFIHQTKKSRWMKKTASYCIYINEIFFYLCTFSSGWKFHLGIKRAIVQLLNSNSKIHKSIRKKIEFCKTDFCDGANFNNFWRVIFCNLGPKLPKQVPWIFFHLKFLLAKNSTNNSKTILKQEKLMA